MKRIHTDELEGYRTGLLNHFDVSGEAILFTLLKERFPHVDEDYLEKVDDQLQEELVYFQSQAKDVRKDWTDMELLEGSWQEDNETKITDNR